MKNFYKILGVLDDAEDVVIRAAYKALAQRYHPDKWRGQVEDAHKKMADLNEAYTTLSDPKKRKEYDDSFFTQSDRNDADNTREDSSPGDWVDETEGWEMAIDFFPEIKLHFSELKMISGVLANTYKFFILETKDFKNSKEIAKKLELDYLEKYYGNNRYIQNYSRSLLKSGFSDAALEVNRILRFMGESVDLAMIKSRVNTKFPEVEEFEKSHSFVDMRLLIAKARAGDISASEAIIIIERTLKTTVEICTNTSIVTYQLIIEGQQPAKLTVNELVEYAIKLVFENNL